MWLAHHRLVGEWQVGGSARYPPPALAHRIGMTVYPRKLMGGATTTMQSALLRAKTVLVL